MTPTPANDSRKPAGNDREVIDENGLVDLLKPK